MLKNKKGITLIALVVTIVVLLILDENGIIAKSKDARNANRAGAIKEEITLWKADKFAADNGAGSHESMDDFLARLKTRGLISDEDIATIKDTRKLQVGKEIIVFPSDAKTLVQAFKDNEIKVGDYLNYNDYVDETKTCTTLTNENGWADQKYTATKNTYWQVLGLDSTGEKLMLISQSPIKKEMKTDDTAEDWEKTPYLVLKGAYGYVNGKTILNNISGIYNTELGEAKSITAEEINRLVGGITVDYENKTVYSNADKTTSIGKTTDSLNYTYQEGDYSPESYINKKTETKGKSIPTDAYNYIWVNLAIPNTLKTMLFSGTEEGIKSYWLASLAVCCVDSDWAHFGPGAVIEGGLGTATGMSLANGNYFGRGSLFASFGDWNATGFSVRPVIYLNPEVTGEELHVINSQEDKEDWTSYLDVIGGDPMIARGNSSNGEAGNHGTSSGGETGGGNEFN